MKVNIIQTLILLFAIIGCKPQLDNSVETSFYSQDSLYKITFNKPIELDTFYNWKDQDDNACSDEHKYRFSKNEFPTQQETGFFWTSYADSTYRITFKHVEKFDCKEEMDYEKWGTPKEYLNKIIERAKEDKMQIDTLFSKYENVNQRKYILCAYNLNEGYKNGYSTNYLKAITTVDSNLIVITADCRSKKCNGFIERMTQSIKTINIERQKMNYN